MPVRVNPKPAPTPEAKALEAVADGLRQTVEAVTEHNRAVLDAVRQATRQSFGHEASKRVTAIITERDQDGRAKTIEMTVTPIQEPV
jgi:hypothetical protein